MDQDRFIKRLIELRIDKGVSARDMSLSLGQSAGYINNIENGVSYPSMAVFFYICDFFGITPKEFFDMNSHHPIEERTLLSTIKSLNYRQIEHLTAIAEDLGKTHEH